MDNYLDSTSPEYVRRMASALNAKWEALEPYVTPGARVLDYGCGMPACTSATTSAPLSRPP